MTRIFKKIVKEKRGDGPIDTAITIIIIAMVMGLALKVLPVFIVKSQLNTLANQVLRESQIKGMIEIDYSNIADGIGIDIDTVEWESNTFSGNKVQLDETITVICSANVEIGLFGDFGSFPIPLKGKATGKSEVFWKSE